MKHVAGVLLFLSDRLAVIVLVIAILACIKLVADNTTPQPHATMVIVPIR